MVDPVKTIYPETGTKYRKTRTSLKPLSLPFFVRRFMRYTTDVGISDNGRFLKGFSIRGVEGNRVGISVDGVNLPDSEEKIPYIRVMGILTLRA